MKRNKAKYAIIGLLFSTSLIAGVFFLAKANKFNKLLSVFHRSSSTSESGRQALTRHPPLPEPQIGEQKLTACYESFLGKKPKRDEGAVVVSWTVEPDGNVELLKLVQTDLNDEAFNRCILEALKKTHYSSAASRKLLVSHKFNFKRRDTASNQ